MTTMEQTGVELYTIGREGIKVPDLEMHLLNYPAQQIEEFFYNFWDLNEFDPQELVLPAEATKPLVVLRSNKSDNELVENHNLLVPPQNAGRFVTALGLNRDRSKIFYQYIIHINDEPINYKKFNAEEDYYQTVFDGISKAIDLLKPKRRDD